MPSGSGEARLKAIHKHRERQAREAYLSMLTLQKSIEALQDKYGPEVVKVVHDCRTFHSEEARQAAKEALCQK